MFGFRKKVLKQERSDSSLSLETLEDRFMLSGVDFNDLQVAVTSILLEGNATTIRGISADDVAIDRNRLLIRDTELNKYWNGSDWVSQWTWVSPDADPDLNNWSYTLFDLEPQDPERVAQGFSLRYTVTAFTFDSSNNQDFTHVRAFRAVPDETPPLAEIDEIEVSGEGNSVTIHGRSVDNAGIDRTRLLVFDTDNRQYWNGSEWTSQWSWFDPTGSPFSPFSSLNWSYTLDVEQGGNYTTTAFTYDWSGNSFRTEAQGFSVAADETPPAVAIDSIEAAVDGVTASPGNRLVTIEGTSSDDRFVERVRLTVHDSEQNLYWNGTDWTSNWSWFDAEDSSSFLRADGVEDWHYTLELSPGVSYNITAFAFDSSGNVNRSETQQFGFEFDNDPPTVAINSIELVLPFDSGVTASPGNRIVAIQGGSSDNIFVERTRLLVRDTTQNLYWNGTDWVSNWSSVDPVGQSQSQDNWTYTLELAEDSNYSIVALAFDTSGNSTITETHRFFAGPDEQAPTVAFRIDVYDSSDPRTVISGTSLDNVAVDRNRLLVFDTEAQRFWNGSAWTSQWSWFNPDTTSNRWDHALDLEFDREYSVTAWTWDTSNNRSTASTTFSRSFSSHGRELQLATAKSFTTFPFT